LNAEYLDDAKFISIDLLIQDLFNFNQTFMDEDFNSL